MATRKKSKKKPGARKLSPKRKTTGKKSASGNKKKRSAQGARKRPRGTRRTEYPVPRAGRGALAGRQSGDLQGLSRLEDADAESVDELLEEGNAFEAGVVEGVEDAESRSERPVHTREVPQDDVPEEYLDKDK